MSSIPRDFSSSDAPPYPLSQRPLSTHRPVRPSFQLFTPRDVYRSPWDLHLLMDIRDSNRDRRVRSSP